MLDSSQLISIIRELHRLTKCKRIANLGSLNFINHLNTTEKLHLSLRCKKSAVTVSLLNTLMSASEFFVFAILHQLKVRIYSATILLHWLVEDVRLKSQGLINFCLPRSCIEDLCCKSCNIRLFKRAFSTTSHFFYGIELGQVCGHENSHGTCKVLNAP